MKIKHPKLLSLVIFLVRGDDGEILRPRIWRGTLRGTCAPHMELKKIVPKMLAELGTAPWRNEGDGASMQGEKIDIIMSVLVWSLGDGC